MSTIQHYIYCTVQPGETGPRLESFRAQRTNERGVVTARPLVDRCLDCGAQTVDGRPVEG